MATSSSPQTILVVGATGKQGSSVVKALLASSNKPHILALTRDPTSARSVSLSNSPHVTLLEGSPASPKAIFDSATSEITSMFLVTVHGGPGEEEAQAAGLIDAAIQHGVQHIVFSSADRGGNAASDLTETPVAHIATKFRIEQYLRKACAATKGTRKECSWTFLRPVTFFDNLTDDFKGKGFAAMWSLVGSRRVQFVDSEDIGLFAAKALLAPDQYAGKSVGVAGDELNFEEACEVFRKTTGKDMPTTFCVVGKVLKKALGDIGAMFTWFEKEGYNVDLDEARREVPSIKNFEMWLRTSSAWKNQCE